MSIKKISENLIAPNRSLVITNESLIDNENWQLGSLKVYNSTRGLRLKTAPNTFDLFNAPYILEQRTITSELIGVGQVKTINLADGCVTNDKIADRTINHIKLQLNTITSDEMGPDSVTTVAIKDKAVTGAKIADETITETNLANGCVTNPKLGLNSVGTANLMNNSITEDKLINGCVTNSKLADDAVTYNKIKPYTILGGNQAEVNGVIVQGNIAAETITSWNIKANSLNTQVLMDGAVTYEKLGAGSVYGNAIKPGGLAAVHFGPGCVTEYAIADNALSTSKYQDKSITKEKLADDVYNSVLNAVIYDENGNVTMLRKDKCDVVIGSATNDKSNANGSLTVNGIIKADRVYNMAYADIAEGYEPGEELEPGDAAYLREDGKVYKSDGFCVGVVSDEYAMCLGASDEELETNKKVAVAVIGKVHVKTKYSTILGGEVIALGGAVVGKALEKKDKAYNGGCHKVLCLVRPR